MEGPVTELPSHFFSACVFFCSFSTFSLFLLLLFRIACQHDSFVHQRSHRRRWILRQLPKRIGVSKTLFCVVFFSRQCPRKKGIRKFGLEQPVRFQQQRFGNYSETIDHVHRSLRRPVRALYLVLLQCTTSSLFSTSSASSASCTTTMYYCITASTNVFAWIVVGCILHCGVCTFDVYLMFLLSRNRRSNTEF